MRQIVSLDMGVEVWGTRGEGDLELGLEGVKEIRALCELAPFVSVHSRRVLWQWDPQGLSREIAFCKAIGTYTLVLHRESLGLYDPPSRPDFPAIVRLAAEARKAEVMLVLENGRDTLWALDLALDEIGDDPSKTNLGICVDVGHAHLSQDAGRQPIQNYLERYRSQLIHVHLHDNLTKEDDHLLPGEGSIDWPDLFRTLGEIGYHGPAVLELHPKGDPLAAIVKARGFLSSLG